MDVVRQGDAEIRILPVVRGLPSEAGQVIQAFRAAGLDASAMSVSPEDLEQLRHFRGTPIEPENVEDEVYMAGLSAWEEPTMPPPCFTEAVRQATSQGLPLEALDFGEEEYADTYASCVSALELIMQGRMELKLSKTKFNVSTPQQFVLAWDAKINRPAGFAALQHRREQHMAVRLREIAARADHVLAIIEVERARGVLAALRAD